MPHKLPKIRSTTKKDWRRPEPFIWALLKIWDTEQISFLIDEKIKLFVVKENLY